MLTLPDRLAAVLERHALKQSAGIAEQERLQMELVRTDASVVQPLKPGQQAPFFALTDQHGNVVRSSDILARGPLIVAFFRGAWCPYCNEDLAALAKAYREIRQEGTEVVAVTPQLATTKARAYPDERHVPFPILVDPDFVVECSFGVAYKMPGNLPEPYEKAFPMIAVPGDTGTSWCLRTPAHFVIAKDGTILDAPTDDARTGNAMVTVLTSDEAASPNALRDRRYVDEDERRRFFGDVLRRCRLAIPVETKALGPFTRLSNRVGKAVSQEEFAEAIGISRSWYGFLEIGRPVQPSVELLERICEALMLRERQRLTLFELGLPAFARRAVRLGRGAVLEASILTQVSTRAS
jgi:peroxiredoxin/DNA-binding XRE family transcriptional regulator